MKQSQNLTEQAIKEALSQLQFNWQIDNGSLSIQIKTSDFTEAVWLIDEIAKHAAELNHHPDFCLKKLQSAFSEFEKTHTSNGLTSKDFVLAEKIDGIITRIKN